MILINKRRSAGNFPCLYLTRANINLLLFTGLSRLNPRSAFATGYICPCDVVACSTRTITSLGISMAQSPGFSPPRFRFNTRLIYVRFTVKEMALGHVFCPNFCPYTSVFCPNFCPNTCFLSTFLSKYFSFLYTFLSKYFSFLSKY